MSKIIYNSVDNIINNYINESDFLNNINKIVNKDTTNKRTIVCRYSLIKGYIKKTYPNKFNNELLERIKPDISITDDVFKLANISRINKQSITFTKSDIDKLLGLKDSINDIDKIIYCCFISGRRFNEIFKSKFLLIPRKDNIIKVSQLSKTKYTNNTHTILLLGSARDFKKKILSIRKKYKMFLLSDINKRTNTRLKLLMGLNFHLHNLRGYYAIYSWNTLNNKIQSLNGWVQTVLNHESGDSSINYSNYIYDSLN